MRPLHVARRFAARRFGEEVEQRGFMAWVGIITLLAVVAAAFSASLAHAQNHGDAWTVSDLWAQPRPYAQGHRGSGSDEFGAALPLENTLDGFHTAFANGIRVVELDLQQTADGRIVVCHEDAIAGRCVSAMTYDELLALRPQVPLFRSVLNSDRHFSSDDCTSGIIFAEIKVPIPNCNADTTAALAAITESQLVAAVVADIRQARMEEQVVINAGSPSILHQAMLQAPEIQRALSLNILQLLPPSAIPGMTGYTVRRIPRDDCGLDWYEVSNIARLPTFYPSQAGQPQAFQRFVLTTLGCARAKAVSIDKLVLLSNPPAAPAVVGALHAAGLEVVAWTVDTQQEWSVCAGAGVDGITTNNVSMGLQLQAAATCAVAVHGLDRREDRTSLADARPALSLDGARAPQSGARAVEVQFSLADAGAARLSLVDVAGRLIDSRDVSSFGAGRHQARLGDQLAAGVYFVRLNHAQGEARMKTTVLR